jgi:hypothetical protein
MVLEMIRQGRLVLVTGGQSFKTSSRDYQAQVHSDQMVLVIARLEVGPCEQKSKSKARFSEDAQIRVGKQLKAAKNLTEKKAE